MLNISKRLRGESEGLEFISCTLELFSNEYWIANPFRNNKKRKKRRKEVFGMKMFI